MSEAGEVDTETLLRRVSDIISNTKSLPLTSTYKLDNKEEVLELLDEARRLRHEAEDYCDQRLASFEIVLERTIKTVQAGRQKLQATPPSAPSGPAVPAATGDGGHDADAFFDQDQ